MTVAAIVTTAGAIIVTLRFYCHCEVVLLLVLLMAPRALGGSRKYIALNDTI